MYCIWSLTYGICMVCDQILDPVSVLVVVDVQNDFITGTMAIKDCPAKQNALDIIPIINSLIQVHNHDDTHL